MKDEIREKLKIKRLNFTGEERDRADSAISKKFFEEFGGFDSYFVYNSFSQEASTAQIIDGLLKAQKRVYLPRVEGDNMVAVPYGKTVKSAYGIAEPTGQAYYGKIDVTVIPLLAVNKSGFRIGYGKGYYDRYLKTVKTVKVGLGYSYQLVDFTGDSWDEPLDYFLCEKGLYAFNGNIRG